jgi:hypothetical protein
MFLTDNLTPFFTITSNAIRTVIMSRLAEYFDGPSNYKMESVTPCLVYNDDEAASVTSFAAKADRDNIMQSSTDWVAESQSNSQWLFVVGPTVGMSTWAESIPFIFAPLAPLPVNHPTFAARATFINEPQVRRDLIQKREENSKHFRQVSTPPSRLRFVFGCNRRPSTLPRLAPSLLSRSWKCNESNIRVWGICIMSSSATIGSCQPRSRSTLSFYPRRKSHSSPREAKKKLTHCFFSKGTSMWETTIVASGRVRDRSVSCMRI